LLLGDQVAGIGNAMVLWLIIGGLILILWRQITWHIPVSFLLGVAVISFLGHLVYPDSFPSVQFQLLSGSTVFTTFFLVTDHTTSPVNKLPMIIYGFLGGLVLVLIRSFSIFYDGAVFAVLLINLCNPLIDRITPKVYGLEVKTNA
jgi:electron transport complex protein RnfD